MYEENVDIPNNVISLLLSLCLYIIITYDFMTAVKLNKLLALVIN